MLFTGFGDICCILVDLLKFLNREVLITYGPWSEIKVLLLSLLYKFHNRLHNSFFFYVVRQFTIIACIIASVYI